ncbi:hypothetical protein ACFSJ3_14185 [Corallincola platygyrae]|uniref:Uncharacterized protein n=1 Tax=Corallincola platygyrae TaxID=1193278 RepID=A0ABW4XNH6_9GAMM
MDNENLTPGQKGSFTRLRNQIKEEANTLLGELRQNKHEISELHKYLLEDDDEGKCLKSQLQDSKNEISDIVERTDSLLTEIIVTHERIHEASNGLLPEIESSKFEIEEILEETSASRKKFKESYVRLYGDQDSEEGLESKLESLFEKYEDDLETHQSRSEELLAQIEGALSGATNVELAKAFQDQKNSYRWPKNIWTFVFVACIAIMVYLANDLNGSGEDKLNYTVEFLKRLPLFGPLIWLALFSSKQQSQSKRLQEEYAHKETIAKTYVGHKRQIEKLNDSEAKEELTTKLAASTIEAIDFNPSSTLEKHNHKEDLPASELAKLLKSALDKIGTK